MGILSHTSNISKSNSKIPDYARDYRNEYLFIRGIDKTCDGLEMKLYYPDKEIFKSAKFDKMKRLINKFVKAQKLGYLNPIQTGGGLFDPPSGKIVITPTPKEL